jgi:hypothetical protein
MVTVLQHGVLYREPRFHAAFPSLVRFSDDRLLLAFRRGRDGLWLVPAEQREAVDPFERMDHIDSRSHIVLMELDPAGERQLGRLDMLPVDPEAGDQDPSLLVLPDDKLFLASFSWYPLPADPGGLPAGRDAPGDNKPGCRFLYWGSHASLREREAGRWLADHRYLEPDGGFGRPLSPCGSKSAVSPVRGQPLLHGGEILLPLYGTAEQGCALFASADHGKSWRFRGLIARDDEAKVAYQEPALCPDGQGGMICFMRTAGTGGRLATSRSADGVHWSEPVLHDLVGEPFHPLLLADGRLLLSFGYRAEPYGIRARLLDRPTDDPDQAAEIIVRDDGLCPDVGYPWAAQLADGRVLLSYYWTDADGIRLIAASWLAVDGAQEAAA